MLGPYAGIIQASTDRMGAGNLAIFVFHQVSTVTVQYARATGTQGCGMLAGFNAQATGFHSVKLNRFVGQDGVEHFDCVGTTTHYAYKGTWLFPGFLQ